MIVENGNEFGDMVNFEDLYLGDCFLSRGILFQKLEMNGEYYYSNVRTGDLWNYTSKAWKVMPQETKCVHKNY